MTHLLTLALGAALLPVQAAGTGMAAEARLGVDATLTSPMAAALAGTRSPAPVPPPTRSGDPDFLFGPPGGAIGLRGGLNLPRARSDLYDFVTDELTLDRNDFRSASTGLEIAVRVHPRVDAAFGIGRSQATERSEYRDWIGEDDLPIEQTTGLRQVPVTAGAKLYLMQRGRQIGEFAWVPTRLALFAGGGAGATHYRFEQDGEFVDFQDQTIFQASYESSGWAPTGYLSAGADLSLTDATYLSAEARQTWAGTELGQDFVDFEPIDLSGFQLTLGIHRRF